MNFLKFRDKNKILAKFKDQNSIYHSTNNNVYKLMNYDTQNIIIIIIINYQQPKK